MGWLHASGYPPANDHFGYPAAVLTDGTDSGDVPLHDQARVLGWRAGCECGWRSDRFYPRSEWPSLTGRVPPAIEGSETRTGMFAEWSRHLDRAVPELPVLDYARQLDEVTTRLADAVRAARRAGVSWQRIGEVSGMSAGQAAQGWGERPSPSRTWSVPRRGSPHRRRDAGPAR